MTSPTSGPAMNMASADGDPLHQWCAALDDAYPPGEAEGWDPVGLHVGDRVADVVTGVLVALDVTPATLQEAADVGADLMVVHHPLIFGGLERLDGQTAPSRLALQAARQGCAVLAAHTNVDKAAAGTSHPAATLLGLTDLRPLAPLPADPGDQPVKLVTFVPDDAADRVRQALADAGAGQIGDYSGCAFTSAGEGTFVPGPSSAPHIGSVGVRETVAEQRVEVVARRADLPRARQALAGAHPYEEPPMDVYPLIEPDPPAVDRGIGLVGVLPRPTPLREIAERLAEGLPSPHLRLAAAEGDADQMVSTVAICGGAGDSYIPSLIGPQGPTVDVYITGDLKHHPTTDALTMGLSLIDAGHFATENPAMDDVVTQMQSRRGTFRLSAPIHRSTVSTEPWTPWRSTR